MQAVNLSQYDIYNKEETGEDTYYSIIIDLKSIYDKGLVNLTVKITEKNSYTNETSQQSYNYNMKCANSDVLDYYDIENRVGSLRTIALSEPISTYENGETN